jgi:hypothetical protein
MNWVGATSVLSASVFGFPGGIAAALRLQVLAVLTESGGDGI